MVFDLAFCRRPLPSAYGPPFGLSATPIRRSPSAIAYADGNSGARLDTYHDTCLRLACARYLRYAIRWAHSSYSSYSSLSHHNSLKPPRSNDQWFAIPCRNLRQSSPLFCHRPHKELHIPCHGFVSMLLLLYRRV